MDYSTLDDEALIRLILHNRSEALSELYDRYSRLVYSIAYHVVGDQETAEEITQDVFLKVWQKAVTYRPGQSRLSTWLTSITRYRAIDLLRQRGVRPEGHSIAWEEVTGSAEPHISGLEDDVEERFRRNRVRQAVASLPVDQQKALALAYFQGLSHSEIAGRLGEPLGTVKTRIRLAMQKLRELLHDDLRVF